MISIKKKSGKQCVYCDSTDTVDAKVRGIREFQGAICMTHLWKLVPSETNGKKTATEEKSAAAR